MAYDFAALEKSLREKFGDAILDWTNFRDQPCVHLKRDKLRDVMKFLKTDASTSFDIFTDVSAVDLLKLPFDQRLVRFGFRQVLASFFNLLA